MATGDVIVWMDCDLSMPPEDVPRLLAEVAGGSDIAVGSRFVAGGRGKGDTGGTPDPQITVLLSAGLNIALRLLLHRGFRDWTSGFIAIRREVLQTLGLRGDHGEYFIDLMYRALRRGYRVVEIPYVIVPRRHGASKTASSLRGYVRRGLQYVGIALSLRWDALRGRI